MTRGVLIDADVLIDYTRGNRGAVRYLDDLQEPPSISVITVSELYAGVRPGDEQDKLDALVNALRIAELTSEVARVGGLYRRDYGRTHGVGIGDALIAATARLAGLSLVTLNKKHFPMLDDVIVPYRKT